MQPDGCRQIWPRALCSLTLCSISYEMHFHKAHVTVNSSGQAPHTVLLQHRRWPVTSGAFNDGQLRSEHLPSL